MSRGPVALPALVLAVLMGGCVLGPFTMNVGYDESKAARGPLSAVGSRRIRIDVTDRRPQPGELISYINRPVVAPRPVREIVQDALATELRNNDHVVVPGEADRFLNVDVREFWFSIQQGFWTTRYSGAALIRRDGG